MSQVQVSGESFGDHQKIIKNYCQAGMPVHLVREPDNQYDSNAIAVYIEEAGNRHQIGYINRESAAYYAPRFDAGKNYESTIYEVYGGDGRKKYGVVLEIFLLSKKEKARREKEVIPPAVPDPKPESPDAIKLPQWLKKLFNFREN